MEEKWIKADKPIDEYPDGTKYLSIGGGYWIKLGIGRYKWVTGSTFPRVGGDWSGKIALPQDEEKKCNFNKGDVIVTDNSIAVFEKIDINPETGNMVVYYSTLYNNRGRLTHINRIDCGIGYEDDCKLANKEERNILINALKKEAYNGNSNAIYVLKKVFDITISKNVIKTYRDLIYNDESISGYFVSEYSELICSDHVAACEENENIASNEKTAKSMLAMAMISQLMPYYGGEITDGEWLRIDVPKYIIYREFNYIKSTSKTFARYCFLAFHTAEQRDEFLKYNERLVKDYLMID